MQLFRRVTVGAVLLALAAIGIYTARPKPAPPVDFSDDLTGPASPHLIIPFDAYSLTPEGLLRSRSVTADGFGNDRPVVKTRSGAYLSREFIFEIDIAFVGFGLGDPNPAYNMEPAGAFMFRIHNLTSADRVDVVAALPPRPRTAEAGPPAHARLLGIGTYPPGVKTTFRIEHGGNRVTLSMPGQAGASHTFERSSFPELFDRDAASLFFGNSAKGTIFSNVRVRPLG